MDPGNASAALAGAAAQDSDQSHRQRSTDPLRLPRIVRVSMKPLGFVVLARAGMLVPGATAICYRRHGVFRRIIVRVGDVIPIGNGLEVGSNVERLGRLP